MTNYLESFQAGLGNVYSLEGLFYVCAGTLLAMITSFLPGIGGASVTVLIMVATATWDPVPVLLLFGALTGGATFMGSITAIIFGIPGNASSASALLDGNPLARKGYPQMAIAAAATSSALGSIFGVVVMIAALPLLRGLILEFGPLERLLVGIWGLMSISALPRNSLSKALAMTSLGLLAALIGNNANTGEARWIFGTLDLYSGLPTVPLLVGMFTIAELLGWSSRYRIGQANLMRTRREDSIWLGIRAVFKRWGLVIRSSVTGTIVGIVPGVGGTVAGFVSYGQAMQFGRKTRARFGKGDIRGLIAPEAAMDAKDGGSLIPALAFGLPGSEGGILLLAMFAMHGITPGRDMFGPHLDFTFTLVLALLLSNILTSVVGVALTPLLSRISNFRIDRLALPLFIVTAITMVQMEGQVTHLFVTIIFGMLAYLFARFDWPRVPFLIAFILGDLIEVNLNLTGQLMAVGRIVPYERPVAIFIAVIILATLAWMLRRTAFRDKTRPDTLPDDVLFPSFLFLCVGAMTVTAILNPGPQTRFTAAVLALALTTLGLVAGRAWRRQLATGKGILPPRLLEPANLLHPITLIALLPLVAMLVGLHLGLAALTFFWLAGSRDITPRNMARAMLWAVIAAASSWGLLVGWAHYYLPKGLLFGLLTGG